MLLLIVTLANCVAIPVNAQNRNILPKSVPIDLAKYITTEEKDYLKTVYKSLDKKSKKLFKQVLNKNKALRTTHKKYVDKNYKKSSKNISASGLNAVSTINTLNKRLVALGLPVAVCYSLVAVGCGLVAAGVDGPLPVGDVIALFIGVGAVGVLVYYWSEVAPKWNDIKDIFLDVFKPYVKSIDVVFTKLKDKIVKKVKKKVKSTDKVINKALNDFNKSKKKHKHVLQAKHDWNKVVKGKVTWKKVYDIMKLTMKYGKEMPYKTVTQRVIKFKGEYVVVTFKKISDTVWKISDAWVDNLNTFKK